MTHLSRAISNLQSEAREELERASSGKGPGGEKGEEAKATIGRSVTRSFCGKGVGGGGAWNSVGLLYQSSELDPRTKGTEREFYSIMAGGVKGGGGGHFVFAAYRPNVSQEESEQNPEG